MTGETQSTGGEMGMQQFLDGVHLGGINSPLHFATGEYLSSPFGHPFY